VYMSVYTAVHGVYGRCTPACNGRVHSASTAVYTVHLRGRVLCTRPCLLPVYTAAHGRVQTVYTAVHGPRTWSVRPPYTSVYRELGRLYGPCARHCTYRVHRRSQRVRIVYTVVQGRVHGASTAMYMVHLHGRVLCTRPCLRPVYTAAHGRVQTVYTAVHGHVHGPSVTRSRPCTRPIHGRVP